MTIQAIKRLTIKTATHFFDRATLRFFGQTMHDFSVHKLDDSHYLIEAPRRDFRDGRRMGTTRRIFNASTNELQYVPDSAGYAITH